MSDLQGRLFVLRDRARDDTMKRRSLQSLRTPSPFTAAEQWYSSSKNYAEPLSADAGVASPPWKDPMNGTVEVGPGAASENTSGYVPEYAPSDVTSVYEDVDENNHVKDGVADSHEPHIPEESEEGYDTADGEDQKEEAGE